MDHKEINFFILILYKIFVVIFVRTILQNVYKKIRKYSQKIHKTFRQNKFLSHLSQAWRDTGIQWSVYSFIHPSTFLTTLLLRLITLPYAYLIGLYPISDNCVRE